MSLVPRSSYSSASTEDMVSEITQVDEPWFADEACSSMDSPASYLNLLDLVQGSLALQGHLSISSAGASRSTTAMSVNGSYSQPNVTQASLFPCVGGSSSYMDVEEPCGLEGPWIARSVAQSRAANLQAAWSPALSRWGSGALVSPTMPRSRLDSNNSIPPSRLASCTWQSRTED